VLGSDRAENRHKKRGELRQLATRRMQWKTWRDQGSD
jgi:hypothetical protein